MNRPRPEPRRVLTVLLGSAVVLVGLLLALQRTDLRPFVDPPARPDVPVRVEVGPAPEVADAVEHDVTRVPAVVEPEPQRDQVTVVRVLGDDQQPVVGASVRWHPVTAEPPLRGVGEVSDSSGMAFVPTHGSPGSIRVVASMCREKVVPLAPHERELTVVVSRLYQVSIELDPDLELLARTEALESPGLALRLPEQDGREAHELHGLSLSPEAQVVLLPAGEHVAMLEWKDVGPRRVPLGPVYVQHATALQRAHLPRVFWDFGIVDLRLFRGGAALAGQPIDVRAADGVEELRLTGLTYTSATEVRAVMAKGSSTDASGRLRTLLRSGDYVVRCPAAAGEVSIRVPSLGLVASRRVDLD